MADVITLLHRQHAEARVTEERRAKELLSTMNDIGPEAEGFVAVVDHARDAIRKVLG